MEAAMKFAQMAGLEQNFMDLLQKLLIAKHKINEAGASLRARQSAYGTFALSLFCGGSLAFIVAVYKLLRPTPKRLTFGSAPKMEDGLEVYDVIVVGAGPSGSTCAYYLAQEGYKVLMIEKKKFPRDKFCGDVLSPLAQDYLRQMGVMKEIIDEGKGHFIQSSGFVSPCGNSFVGNPAQQMKYNDAKYNRGPALTVKRLVLDEKIVRAAQRMGAQLVENTGVHGARFSRETGVWTIDAKETNDGEVTFKGRVLVCADGATSRLARSLDVVKTDSNGVCSRSYIKENTSFKWDSLVFYPPVLLPGFCSIHREPGNELNYITYITSGGQAKEEDLSRLHHHFLKHDPYIMKALGVSPNMERMKAASVRVGGEEKTYGDHLLVVGDAAGFVDPATCQGIQYSMHGSKIAAEVLIECFRKKDLSAASLKMFQDRWCSAFGKSFQCSTRVKQMLCRFPILLDACAKLIQRRGNRYLVSWAEAMTGRGSKSWFLRLDFLPFLVLELFGEVARRQFKRSDK